MQAEVKVMNVNNYGKGKVCPKTGHEGPERE
jgi:hypothetical protein